MNKKPYTVIFTGSESPETRYGIDGPGQGFGYHAWYLFPENTFSTKEDAEKAARMMNTAFVEGQREKARTIRELLND